MQISDEWHQEVSLVNYKIVSSLQPCSEYEFKVQVLLQGESPGPFSATVKTKTQRAQTSAPQNVQAVLKPGNMLQITWDPPATYCNVITNYKVSMLSHSSDYLGD